MKRGQIVAVVVALAAGLGVGAVVLTRPDPAPAGEPVVLGFGDSIAAGQGVGPAGGYPNNPGAYPALVAARLGWRSHNFAIAGACAATGGTSEADPATPETCARSILSDQIPRVAEVYRGMPGLVLVTAGANDVQFDECAQAEFLPVQAAAGGCAATGLDERLGALGRNLGRVLGELRSRWPAATIVVSTYYNPTPDPPASDAGVCPLYEPLAALRNPLALAGESALRDAARGLQASLHERFQDIVDRLNDTIRAAAVAAGAAVAAADFAGHHLCVSATGGTAADQWVYGPDVDLRFEVTGSTLLGPGKRWDYTLPSVCPDQSQEPDPIETGTVTRRLGLIEITYSADLRPNCMPHPTPEGQQALAASVLAALPDSFTRQGNGR